MPAESRLQTSFFPSQQFCEALSPSAPQMFPGGLQLPPLVQRPTPPTTPPQATCWLGGARSLMLQHSAVEVQESPVIRQPPAGWQTVAPVPGSRQSRVQQLEGPAQGLPSCVQLPAAPPDETRQRPALPSLAEQRLPQQSALPKQMSPFAWQE
jgi:hypothetical protein